ncbi:MAG TPA: TlpA disulfide reductase family protein, partial [Bacteroidota bacterium]|nr:TlpA disulfide reductase family protein [Bacteroidota bacterium]
RRRFARGLTSDLRTALLAAVLSLVLAIPLAPVLAQLPSDSLAAVFSLPTLDGRTLSLEQMLGEKLTILVFWAMWGKDSSRVLEEMEALYRSYHDRGLAVLGVCVDSQSMSAEDTRRIADSLKRKDLTFPVVLDNTLQTSRAYAVIAIPTTFVLSKERKILFKLSGFPIVGRENLRDFVVERFQGPKPIAARVERTHTPGKEALRLFGMARVNHERGLTDLAVTYAGKAQSADSLYAEPYVLMAEIALEQDRIQPADSLCAIALRLEPRLAATRRLHGLLLAMKGETADAIVLLTALTAGDSGSALTHAYLGYALGMSGDETGSMNAFAKAEVLVPSDYRSTLLRARVYERLGKKQEAESERAKVKRRIRRQD